MVFRILALPVLEDLHKNGEGASNWSVIAKAIEKFVTHAKELHSSKEPLMIFSFIYIMAKYICIKIGLLASS